MFDRTAPADDQMRQCLANLQQTLDLHGTSLAAVLEVTVYLVDFGQYDAVHSPTEGRDIARGD